jgi:lipoprotein-anchoring transpeptidase ErfK/SrfK
MRLLHLAAAAACFVLAATPSFAGSINFSTDTFQIYGGLDNSPAQTPKMRYKGKKEIDFVSSYSPGTVIVRTGERHLYYVLPGNRAIQYGVGVGRDGFTWSGTDKITRKAKWPDWRPPAVMIKREASRGKYLPDYMPGGPDNPLGARALYIGTTEYRIHGTSQPWSIGLAVSSGCIRMLNQEVIDLYNRVDVGAQVVVEN